MFNIYCIKGIRHGFNNNLLYTRYIMANFDEAIQVVLKHEGGLVDDKDDVGGITNYGISLSYLEKERLSGKMMDEIDFNRNDYIDSEDIRHLPLEAAKSVYKTFWWNRYGYSLIEDQELATCIFDIAINIGPRRCHVIFQEAINHFLTGMKIKEDGLLGKITLSKANGMSSSALLSVFKTMVGDFYKEKCRENPNRAKYLRGWLNRLDN